MPSTVTSTSQTSLEQSVAEHVTDGDTIFLGGFGHAVPSAAVREIVRQGKRDLTIVRSGCDILVDVLIARGCARKVVFGWIGNPGIGLAHAFRRAVADGTVEYEEWTNFSLVLRLEAARLGVPFLPARLLRAGDVRSGLDVADVTCPYTGEVLTAIPAIHVDTAIVHAQRADDVGNVQFWGVVGDTATGAMAADRVIATVEEIVPHEVVLDSPNATMVPAHRVAAVSVVPWGAHPSYVDGHYERDDDHYRRYDELARSREGLEEYLRRWVDEPQGHEDYRQLIDESALRPPSEAAQHA
jgi:glutaconate CoA-transferase subunit A